jgi:hypothetical protein
MATLKPATPSDTSPLTSPETSPRRRHKHRKKHSDGFSLPDIPANKDGCSECAAENDQETLVTKLIYRPLIFVSFLLSLTFIDYRDRRYRSSQHSSPSVSRSSTWIDRITSPLSNLLDPEPYQDPSDTTWQRGSRDDQGFVGQGGEEGAQGQRQGDVPHPGRQRWFRTKKHRAMARMEIGDAFEMRGRVAMVIIAAVALGILAVGWGVRRILSRYIW